MGGRGGRGERGGVIACYNYLFNTAEGVEGGEAKETRKEVIKKGREKKQRKNEN